MTSCSQWDRADVMEKRTITGSHLQFQTPPELCGAVTNHIQKQKTNIHSTNIYIHVNKSIHEMLCWCNIRY